MTLSGPRKRCSECKEPMQHWGRHGSGTRRWRCLPCKKNGVRKRKDNRERTRLSLFVRWLTTKASVSDVAKQQKVSVKTLLRWFTPLWDTPPQPAPSTGTRVLVLDATSVVKRQLMLLIAGDADRHVPVSWVDAPRECYDSWVAFLRNLSWSAVTPDYIVCDGQRGLLKAIRHVYPKVKIQRCLIHIIRQASAWLTQCPRTKAGRELLALIKRLSRVQTKRQKRRWVRAFRCWFKRHDTFLKERSYSPSGHWWYTH